MSELALKNVTTDQFPAYRLFLSYVLTKGFK
jgi:hypothetical protein